MGIGDQIKVWQGRTNVSAESIRRQVEALKALLLCHRHMDLRAKEPIEKCCFCGREFEVEVVRPAGHGDQCDWLYDLETEPSMICPVRVEVDKGAVLMTGVDDG